LWAFVLRAVGGCVGKNLIYLERNMVSKLRSRVGWVELRNPTTFSKQQTARASHENTVACGRGFYGLDGCHISTD
jgi:hypothetical protein